MGSGAATTSSERSNIAAWLFIDTPPSKFFRETSVVCSALGEWVASTRCCVGVPSNKYQQRNPLPLTALVARALGPSHFWLPVGVAPHGRSAPKRPHSRPWAPRTSLLIAAAATPRIRLAASRSQPTISLWRFHRDGSVQSSRSGSQSREHTDRQRATPAVLADESHWSHARLSARYAPVLASRAFGVDLPWVPIHQMPSVQPGPAGNSRMRCGRCFRKMLEAGRAAYPVRRGGLGNLVRVGCTTELIWHLPINGRMKLK